MSEQSGADQHDVAAGEDEQPFSLTSFVRNLESLPPIVIERTGAREILDWEKARVNGETLESSG